MRCPNCNHENREGAKFCDECGFPLQGRIAEVAATVNSEEMASNEQAVAPNDNKDSETVESEQETEHEGARSITEALRIPPIEVEDSVVRVPLSDATIPATKPKLAPEDEEEPSEEPIEESEPAPEQATEDEIEEPQAAEEPIEAAPVVEEGAGNVEEADSEHLSVEDIPPVFNVPEVKDVPKVNDADRTQILTKPVADQSAASDDQKTEVLPKVGAAGPDLSGFQTQAIDAVDLEMSERLVDDDYVAPQPNWHDGDTMQMPRVETEEAEETKEYLESSAKKKSHKKPIIITLIVIAIVAALAAGVTYSMELWGGKSVPDVVGMTQADATSVLQNQGFTVRVTQVKSDDTEGLVLVMDPSAGSRLAEGEEVVIHIATARIIPDVIGKTQDEAKSALESEGFTNITYTKQNSDEAEGTVLSVSPDVGERANRTSAITVTVAQPYTVPDVTGAYLTDAEQLITDSGLTYEVVYVFTDSYTEGTIIGSIPEAGTVVSGGSLVSIQIAQSREKTLLAAARNVVVAGQSITIDGINYQVVSLDSVSYAGGNNVNYTMTARPYTTFLGQTVYLDAQSHSGTITFTDTGAFASMT